MHIACKERRNVFTIKVPKCFIGRSTQVHRKLCVTRASLRDQDSLSAGHLEWNSNVEFFPHDFPLEGTLQCIHYIIVLNWQLSRIYCVCVLATQNLKWKKVSFINNESSLDLFKSKFIVGRWAV